MCRLTAGVGSMYEEFPGIVPGTSKTLVGKLSKI